MKTFLTHAGFAFASLILATVSRAEEKSLFNGKDLTGWEGNPDYWMVEDGAITGKTTAEKPLKHNTFLVWQGGNVANFELTFKYRLVKGNSGVQYRSSLLAPGASGPIVKGYQADMEAGAKYSGILYEERGRGILAERGQSVVIKSNPQDPKKIVKEVVGKTGDAAAIQASIIAEGWNDYRIVANGNVLQHFINGHETVHVVDEDANGAAKEGILALQVHAGPAMVVQFKDLILKSLP
jgi:hypothetical protein